MGILNSLGLLQVNLLSRFSPAHPAPVDLTEIFPSLGLTPRDSRRPLPVPNLRQILAMLVDVLFVLDQLILDHLLEVGTLGA
jgi:hypothetical protein